MKVAEIANMIEKIAPKELACDFDNVGLIVGDMNDTVTGVKVVVDVTARNIEDAIESKCNLIISHHPLIFHPIKNVVQGDYVSELVMMAIKNNINIYAAHTNMDKAKGGINDSLAELLGGMNATKHFDDLGVCFDILPITIGGLRQLIFNKIGDDSLKTYGVVNRTVRKIAVISGCGGRDSAIIPELLANNIQVFVTSEVAHHVSLELVARGITVIECGHMESERIFIEIVRKLLAKTINLMVK